MISQGAAVNHRAIEDLSDNIMNQIAGVVTFGDTQSRKDGGKIPNFPSDKIKIFCGGAIHDTVCDGVLSAAVDDTSFLPRLVDVSYPQPATTTAAIGAATR